MIVPAYRPRPVESLSVEDLLGRLESVRGNGESRWMARCPAHGDRTASLSIRRGDDGRILVHDFGGCTSREIVAALGLELRQLFPAADRPWTPRARPDPDREARALLERLRQQREPPPPARMKKELSFIGTLLLGGTKALAEVLATFRAESIRTWPLRLIYLACVELARQRTPRRWLSPEALWREVHRVGGRRDLRVDVYFWCRAATSEARWAT